MYSVTKSYKDLPAAHRQPTHPGHCRLVHGHNWRFDLTFTCDKLDGNGFVVDVGVLGFVKEFLVENFDHTLLLNEDDPHLKSLQNWLTEDVTFAKIVTVPNCGMEGLAKFVFDVVQILICADMDFLSRGVKVSRVVCFEDSKNSATYVAI